MRSLLSALLLSAAAAAPAPAADAPPAGDLARLQGRWTTKAGPRRDIPVVLEVEGHRVLVGIIPPLGRPFRVRGELVLDETAAPRALTWTKFAGLDGQGFSPFGQVVAGMNVVDSLFSGYGEGAPQGRGPDQGRIQREGNAYLMRDFPNLDHVRKATIEK